MRGKKKNCKVERGRRKKNKKKSERGGFQLMTKLNFESCAEARAKNA